MTVSLPDAGAATNLHVEMKMLKNRVFPVLAMFSLVGFAACGGEAEVEPDAVVTDTLVTPETRTVEVPVTVPDTAVVTRDVDVDTDTVDVPPR